MFPPRQDRARAFKAAALVVLVGPPAGSLVLGAATAVTGIADNVTRSSIIADLPQAILGWLTLTLFLAVFCYVYGIVPTLVSCIWLGWRIYGQGTVSMAEAICTAAASVLICASGVSLLTQDFPKGVAAWLIIFGPAAIFSAFVCRRLLRTFDILPLSSPKASA